MLPYRLRPPTYGGTLKKEKLEEAKRKGDTTTTTTTRIPLSGGGPVQEAIELDLIELRNDFLKRLHHEQQQQQQKQQNQKASKPSLSSTTTSSAAPVPVPVSVSVQSHHLHHHHSKTGDSFRVFQTVFTERKVSLLHTKFIPSRCDRGHYSQLIYSACLSLIQRSMMRDVPPPQSTSTSSTSDNNRRTEQEEEEESSCPISSSSSSSSVLDDAGFGLFCLYSLFETNPLPIGILQQQQGANNNNNNNKKMEALSMGLHGIAENPKLHRYRRSYKHPIRIDRFHYTLLLQLREEALAIQAECENLRMNVLCHHLEHRRRNDSTGRTKTTTTTTTTTTNKDEEGRGRVRGGPPNNKNCNVNDKNNDDNYYYCQEWSCRCGIAMDCIEVLGRLFPNLDLCEYTGPGCLDGLAGHADYPYPCVKPNKKQQETIDSNLNYYYYGRMPTTTATKNGGGGGGDVVSITDEILEKARTGNQQQQQVCCVHGAAESTSSSYSSCVIKSHLKSYMSTLQTIQIPSNLSSQKTKMFKETLEPILHSSQPTLEALLSPLLDSETTTIAAAKTIKSNRIGGAAARRGRQRRVTWGAIEEEENPNIKRGNSNGLTNKRKKPGVIRQEMSYELLLPEAEEEEEEEGIPETLHNGIQNALHHIFRRDQPIFLPTTSSSSSNKNAGGGEAQQNNHDNVHGIISDDVSSIGIGGVSLAQSSAAGTAKGGNALKSLLAKASNKSQADSTTMVGEGSSNLPRRRISKPQANFLTMDYDNDELAPVAGRDDGNESETSNLSDSDLEEEEEDTLSVATSAVGQRALATLLSTVSEKNGNQATQNRTSKANGTRRRRQSRSSCRSQRESEEQGDENTEDGGGESVDASRAGKAALAKLLNEAQSTKNRSVPKSRGPNRDLEDSAEESSHAETSCSGQGKASLAALLTQATQAQSPRKSQQIRRGQNKKPSRTDDENNATENASMADADNSLVSGQGRAALSSLLKEAQSAKRQATTRTNTQIRRSTRKRAQTRRQTPEDASQAETNSTVSGQGNTALGNLISLARSSEGRQQRQRRQTKKSVQSNIYREAAEDASQVDDGSLVSVADGAALSSLLDQGESTKGEGLPSNNSRRNQKWWKQSWENAETEDDNGSEEAKDDASQATSLMSGIGKAALESLLNQAQSPGPIQKRRGGGPSDGDKPRTTNRKRGRHIFGVETDQMMHPGMSLKSIRHDDGDVSVAEQQSNTAGSIGKEEDSYSNHTALSGQGNFALNVLLSQVDGTVSPKQRKKLKSRGS